jgi:hypothetical protein
VLLKPFKYGLTRVGARLPGRSLVKIQAAVNYLRIGRWMQEHDFVIPHRVDVREDVWAVVADRVRSRRVLYLEFGVARGASMEYWSRHLEHPEAMLHGFDSFEGLPEAAGHWRKGQFGTNGKVPEIADRRVRLFKGWFEQVLPGYSPPDHEVLVVNMDADLYASTIYVLRSLRPHITKGTFIYFDELNQVDHEARAFDEFMGESGLRFRPVCADKTLEFVMFQCVE